MFPAQIFLNDGQSVTGIAYTDYQNCYTSSDESVTYFETGFIASAGEAEIPEDDFNEGLIIENLEYEDDSTKFVMAYQSDAFEDHCVVYNQYVKYGVNDKGQVCYETSEYERGSCDESLGSLYSYDEARYVLDIDVGEYADVTGQSLSSQLDYKALEEEINKILETQDTNFATVEVETYAYFAQEAVSNYLLSFQEETFLGYDVKELAELASKLDPMECYRITSDGLMTIDLEHSTEDQVAQWLVGSACVVAVAAGMVGAMVFIECPVLSAASGAIAGTAIEIFMQVVIANGTVSDIEWSKVAIAAGAGAVSGFLGPYIMATTSGASYFLVDSALDGIIGGIEQTLYAWMDGESGIEMAKSFGMGFALGFGLSAGFKGVGAVVGKVANKLSPTISKLGNKMFPKLARKVSNFSKVASSKLYGLKKVADSSIFHSKYISKKLAFKQIEKLTQSAASELKDKSFKNLKADGIFDSDGKSITKEALEDIFDAADDNTTIGYFVLNGEKINIKKQNGIVGIVFDESKYQTVKLANGLKNQGGTDAEKRAFRRENFVEAAKEYKKVWIDDPDMIPESIAVALKNQGLDIESATPDDLVDIIQDSSNGWVMHENIDMETITLVARSVHDSARGGITHMGGFSLVGYMKTHMGTTFFDRLVSAAASMAVQAAN